jgi:hypothetical protein
LASTDYFFEGVKAHQPNLLKMPYLQTQSGRVSKSKVVALLYQNSETQVMDIVRYTMRELNKTILASIHDAIIIKERLTVDDKHEIELRMREQTDNPYWRLGVTELQRWEPSQKEALREESMHKQRMKDLEAMATGYKGLFN